VLCDDEKAIRKSMMNLSIDIIIPTYNRPARIPALVESLSRQLEEDDHLFVVWQGKAKPPIAESSAIRSIYSSPPNLPKARNRGIAEGKGGICLFFDDDVEIISKDILEQHRSAHSQEGVGGVVGFLEDPFFVSGNNEPSKYDETTGEIVQNFSLDKSQFTISVMGAHMSFKRRALADAGGFDENFRGNALWEEIDCAFRVRRSGWKIFYCAEAMVRHCREQAGGCRGQNEQSARYMYHQFANTAYFASKHARPRFYGSWLRFWKYRLEFLSRKKMLFLKHDPWLVGAGICGAFGGVLRYVINRK
jgi:GT2 family glycosyltransferase